MKTQTNLSFIHFQSLNFIEIKKNKRQNKKLNILTAAEPAINAIGNNKIILSKIKNKLIF